MVTKDTYLVKESCKKNREQVVGSNDSSEEESFSHEMGNIAGGKRGDVSRCRLCLGRRHVTYSWMKEWVIAGWAFLSTPLLKQKFTIVPAHKKKKE